MANWTAVELQNFEKAQTLQNKPLNDDRQTLAEDNPVWEVVVNNRLFIRGAKGIEGTNWYRVGVKNGGLVGINGQNYKVQYIPVNDPKLINAVTAAYNNKYQGQYPIDLMVSDSVAAATVELVKK